VLWTYPPTPIHHGPRLQFDMHVTRGRDRPNGRASWPWASMRPSCRSRHLFTVNPNGFTSKGRRALVGDVDGQMVVISGEEAKAAARFLRLRSVRARQAQWFGDTIAASRGRTVVSALVTLTP